YVDDIPVRRVDAHHVVEARDAEGILRVELEILRFAREFDPDLVHSHDAGPVLWMYRRAARRERGPLVVTLLEVMTRQFTFVIVRHPALQSRGPPSRVPRGCVGRPTCRPVRGARALRLGCAR